MGTILNTEWEAVPFYRYTIRTSDAGFAGTSANLPTGAGQTQFQSRRCNIPSPKVVLKAT
jgi:hypothetical protein